MNQNKSDPPIDSLVWIQVVVGDDLSCDTPLLSLLQGHARNFQALKLIESPIHLFRENRTLPAERDRYS